MILPRKPKHRRNNKRRREVGTLINEAFSQQWLLFLSLQSFGNNMTFLSMTFMQLWCDYVCFHWEQKEGLIVINNILKIGHRLHSHTINTTCKNLNKVLTSKRNLQHALPDVSTWNAQVLFLRKEKQRTSVCVCFPAQCIYRSACRHHPASSSSTG